MYEKYPTICFASFSFCLIAYIFSPHTDIQIRTSEVSAYEIQTTSGKMATGLSVPIPDARKNDKPKEEYKESCNVECKTSLLKDLGIRDEIAESLVINCKALADNPVKCIKIGSSIVKNESGGGYKCKKYNQYNCFGLSVKEDYKSYNDGVIHWIGKFKKKWYKAKDMSFFYPNTGSISPSRYCTSEHSSNTSVGCPNGLRISTIFYNSLPF